MTLQQLLGIELPIIQAPMAGVQDSELTIAVSNAGGLGSLPCAMLSLERMREELLAIRAATNSPCNLNFFCHSMPATNPQAEKAWRGKLAGFYREYDLDVESHSAAAARAPFSEEMAELLEELRPSVVSFHFGLPSIELQARVQATGAKILSSATTVEEALWLEARGVDAIIAQGLEAGGHRGMFLSADLNTQLGSFALLPQVVRAVKIPVIAAGGIADAQGVAAAMALGAAGVQVGTGYLLCKEARTSTVHRAVLSSEAAGRTVITNLFSGRPARAIVNRLITELGPINSEVPEFPLAASAIAPLRASAEAAGSGDFSPLWAGQNATACQQISAADLTRLLAAGL